MNPLRRYLTVIGIMVAIAVALRVFLGISSGVTLLVLLIGWQFVGTLVTLDDDMPGGWSNPDGKAVPEWKMLWWWADLFLVRGAIVAAAFFLEDAVAGHISGYLLACAVLMMTVGLPLFLRGVRKVLVNAA
ncbi:MAG TPA: hypothetical protein VHL05_06170, partial [Terriglobales bacterium]|jgi:hypothetical protein|nr:hypothetical protein [Terriglobales bacterium]